MKGTTWNTYNTSGITDKYLYKFLSLKDLNRFLKSGDIWFSRSDIFGDKMECVMIADLLKPQLPLPAIETRKKKFLISCWHIANKESLALWDTYAKSDKKRRKVARPEPEPEKEYHRVGYTEDEYKERIPIKEYFELKEYEDYLLNLNIENLKVYVVCSGILYGNSETVFNQLIKDAWQQESAALPYLGDGENLIPTVHVKDLASFVKDVIEKKPEKKYLFCLKRKQ